MQKYLYLLFLLSILSCENSVESEHAGAMPHTIDNRENIRPIQMSKEDRELIASAKGRSVKYLTYSDLANRLEFVGGKLHIFNFWRVDCIPCLENNAHLVKIQAELGEDKIRLIHINMDENSRHKDVNIFIRQEGLIGDIYQLERGDKSEKVNAAGVNWNTELPALYVVDNTKGIKFYYQQEFEYEELKAVVGSLIL
ncbi:MAG: thiol-disulfide isomerase/thioredoxin [Saprospiraceae bacterium]|jgi:thiol-disulfide isomerase/thioredoxin